MNVEDEDTQQRARKRVRFADQPESVHVQQAPTVAVHGLRDPSKQCKTIDESGSVRASKAEFGEHVSANADGTGITAVEEPLTGSFRKETAVLQPYRGPRSFGQHALLAETDVGMKQSVSSFPSSSVGGTTSLEIVPYTGQGSHHVLSVLSDKQCNGFSILPTVAGPQRVEQAVHDLPRGVRLGESSISSGSSGSPPGSMLLARPNAGDGQERMSKWLIVSTEQAKHTAEKLRDQAEKNKVLETTVKSHKRERILIYDAAMKQAAKREEEGINDAKLVLEREQSRMRSEVDQELRKIGDLYQERCRDYAMMVSDECEASISKAAADLRKDWAHQKKTINELVQNGEEENRQVSVIARAVMEQLQEEKRDEIAALRADIYSDVKMEFESREVALRDALQSDYQADLDGQLLLAEIRHQKEVDRLRVELVGGKVCVGETPSGTSDTDGAETQREGGGDSAAQTPTASRRLVGKKVDAGTGFSTNGSGWAAMPTAKQSGLRTKLPAFKTPVQKLSPDLGNTKAARPAGYSASKSIPQSRTLAIGSRTRKGIKRSTVQDSDKTSTRTRKQEIELDGGVTGALIVSPTKAMPGVITPSMETAGRGLGEESSRPKKRPKRLFSIEGS